MSTADQFFPLYPILYDHNRLVDATTSISKEALAHAVCAVATTFSNNVPTVNVSLASIGRNYFETARSYHTANMSSPNFSLDVDTIKTSLLLAIYELTRLPSSTAWTISGQTIRLAYEFGLDRVDAASQHLAARQEEDLRCLWGSLFFLDTFISAIYSRPYAIESTCMEFKLPSTSYEDMAAGHVNKSKNISLGSDLTDLWRDVSGLQLVSATDYQQLFFILLSFQRETLKLRQSRRLDQSVAHRISLIRNSFAALRLVLPDELNQMTILPESICKNSEGERIRVETLLLLHQFVKTHIRGTIENGDQNWLTLSSRITLTLNMPSDENSSHSFAQSPYFQDQWLSCVDAALGIVSVVRRIRLGMVVKLSPTTSATFYLAGLIIAMHRASNEKDDGIQNLKE